MRGYAQSWPALARWQDIDYLLHRAGPGRHVPVEKGRTYTDPAWGQVLYPWDAFLTHIQWGTTAAPRAPTLYLAQHTLLAQFPWMADDFTPPAYAAARDARVQVWMGPAGATSPAHTDPYDNCYVQVVGHKLVWLAPPASNCTGALNVYGGPADMDVCTRHMRNTSRVDVFGPLTAAPATFRTQVVPGAEWVYLHPGDLLLVPKEWWHAMQSTTQVCGYTNGRASLCRSGSSKLPYRPWSTASVNCCVVEWPPMSAVRTTPSARTRYTLAAIWLAW